MKKILFMAALCTFGSAVGSMAQKYSKDVLDKAADYKKTVELNCPQYHTESHILLSADVIARTEIKTKPISSKENYPLLSSIPLKNKCNPSLTRDELNFDPNNFNPLKYFLNWYPENEMVYRVDNTNYIIVIHPQTK